MLLSIITNSVFAEENPYDLPELGSQSLYHSSSTSSQPSAPSKYAANYLKQLTYRQLTESSAVYLDPRGVKLETEYSDDMTTELVAGGDGDVTFTFRVSF